MKKYLAYFLAFFLVGVCATAHAANTKFTNVEVTGTLTVDGATTLTGATTATGVINTSASTPYAIKITSTTAAVPSGTPSAVNLIAVDNNHLVYISTSTNPGGWQKIGAQ
jgi:hypothetical protein